MATLQTMAFSSPCISHSSQKPTCFLSVNLLKHVKDDEACCHMPTSSRNRCHITLLRVREGMTSGIVSHSSRSTFIGQALSTPISQQTLRLKTSRTFSLTIQMVKPSIQFIPGRDEQTIPDVKLTKSRDGTNGMAIFKFDEPSVFDSSGEVGDITGFFMIDEEGTLQSVDVSAKFVNGRPAGIEAKYVMRTPRDWDRFMRFMERYANVNGLQFVKS